MRTWITMLYKMLDDSTSIFQLLNRKMFCHLTSLIFFISGYEGDRYCKWKSNLSTVLYIFFVSISSVNMGRIGLFFSNRWFCSYAESWDVILHYCLDRLFLLLVAVIVCQVVGVSHPPDVGSHIWTWISVVAKAHGNGLSKVKSRLHTRAYKSAQTSGWHVLGLSTEAILRILLKDTCNKVHRTCKIAFSIDPGKYLICLLQNMVSFCRSTLRTCLSNELVSQA